jgi:MFS family permease
MNTNNEINKNIYIILTSLKFYGLIFIMFFAVGIGPGYPGIRNYLIENDVYSNLCKNSNLTKNCEKQYTKLDNVANMSLTLLNATTIIGGLLVDFLGNKLTGIIGIILWTIAMSISGINPNIGTFWEVGFLVYNLSSIMIFFPTLFLYVPSIFEKNKNTIPCALAIITGIWDLSGMSFTVLSDVLNSIQNKPSITLTFLIYGISIGLFSIIFIIYNFGCRERKNNELEIFDDKTICDNVKIQFKSSFNYLKNLIYWAYILNTTVVVTFGYFFISQLSLYLKWHNIENDQIKLYNHNFTYLFAIIGFVTSVTMGFILLNGEALKNTIYLIYLELASSILMTTFIFIPNLPIYFQYVTFTFFIIWRITGFTFVNSTFSIMFENDIGYGKAIGLLYSFSGTVGLICGGQMDKYVQNNINNFTIVNIISCALSVIAPLILYFLIKKKINNDNTHDYMRM